MRVLFVIILAAFQLSLAAAEKTSSCDHSVKPLTMSSDTLIKKYAAYNLWANQQLAAWLEKAPDGAMEMNIESSFNTLRKTVVHIWNAEYLWLRVLQEEAIEPIPGNTFTGSDSALLSSWLAASDAFHLYVSGLDDQALSAFRNRSKPGEELAVRDIIQHTLNHSTYHRGQLITMGRQAGLGTPPRTDFIHYVRLNQKQ
jgi:uncharacterized damage-inducible protein DinB